MIGVLVRRWEATIRVYDSRVPGGLHVPYTSPVSLRPLRPRVGPAGAPTRVFREVRSPAEVARQARGRRRLLPAKERLRLAHVAPRVSAVADGVLPSLQVAPGREAQAGPRPAARSGPKGGGARAQPERSGDRQPGRQRDRRRRTRTRLQWGEAALGQEAPPAGGHRRARARRASPRGEPARPRWRASPPERRAQGRVAAAEAALWADGAYTRRFREWAREERGWRAEVPHHRDRQLWRYGLEEKPRGFLVLPRRWVVERTFAWLGQARRLAKDYERLPETGVAMIHWAMSRIMLRRLTGATR